MHATLETRHTPTPRAHQQLCRLPCLQIRRAAEEPAASAGLGPESEGENYLLKQ